jgi:hypothetical protein
MRRISSLPTAEFCPRVDKIGQEVETTQSARSTVFHAYADSGVWPAAFRNLPEADREEISKWRIPMPFVYKVGDVTHALQYKSAMRETRVALDSQFKPVDVPADVPQADIAEKYPEVMIVGHLDMAWVLPEYDLVIVEDIKSSIFAVKDRCDSLQLHGYGLALAAKTGMGRYLTAIWDASDGRHFVNDAAVELDSFECADIKERIRRAAAERDGGFMTGTHCGGCWKRSHCPAHLIDVPEGKFKAILSGRALEADVRDAIVKVKQLEDLEKRVKESIKAWVNQHGAVRSEDGRKVYKCEMRSGKNSLDQKAVAAALGVQNLDGYQRKGSPYPHYDWRKSD